MITVFIPTPLRKFTDNNSQVEVNASTVGEAISSLAGRYPDLKQHLYDNDQNLRRFIRIYVGEEDIQQLNGDGTELQQGDQVSIIPAIAGGTSKS